MSSQFLSLCLGTDQTKPGETRAALTPTALKLLQELGVRVAVQVNPQRVYPDSDYADLGIPVVATTRGFDAVFCVKEFQAVTDGPKVMHSGQLLGCYHHVHKVSGQEHNHPALRRAAELRCSLLDYELVDGNWTSFHAGVAGAYNGLWAFGRSGAVDSKCSKLAAPRYFKDVECMRREVRKILPLKEDLRILVVGKTGACGRGAAEVCKWLEIPEVTPAEILEKSLPGPWFCLLGTEDVVRQRQGRPFDRDEYRNFGALRFHSSFGQYLDRFNLLMHCPYWDPKFPRLLPQEVLGRISSPIVVSDITCDIRGSLASTTEETTIDDPLRVYDPKTRCSEGWTGSGTVLYTAIGNLPSQVAKTCSEHLSEGLMKILPTVLRADLSGSLEESGLPQELQRGFVLYKGEPSERYKHLRKVLCSS